LPEELTPSEQQFMKAFRSSLPALFCGSLDNQFVYVAGDPFIHLQFWLPFGVEADPPTSMRPSQHDIRPQACRANSFSVAL
jgi:hypothetical protein